MISESEALGPVNPLAILSKSIKLVSNLNDENDQKLDWFGLPVCMRTIFARVDLYLSVGNGIALSTKDIAATEHHVLIRPPG